MEEKLIVCLYGEEGRGKTHTLKILADNLIADKHKNVEWFHPNPAAREKYSKLASISEWPNDICVVIEIDEEKYIGLNSDGDSPKAMKDRLEIMAKKCDTIFCACRAVAHDNLGTLAAIKDTVKKLAKESKEFNVVYTAPYTNDDPPGENPTSPQEKLNRKKAEHLKDFISWNN
jgi:hypothetical protein